MTSKESSQMKVVSHVQRNMKKRANKTKDWVWNLIPVTVFLILVFLLGLFNGFVLRAGMGDPALNECDKATEMFENEEITLEEFHAVCEDVLTDI